jgi:hypothetical protein
MLRDVNRNPRRWVDESRRALVIEGWHPSAPSGVGYNLKVDGDWLGTFESLEAAARAARLPLGIKGRAVVLLPDPSGPGGPVKPNLRLVRPVSPDTP